MIKQPGDTSGKIANGAALVWAKDFAKRRNEKFADAQMFIDSECIKLMKPYTPMLSGGLYESATFGTNIGSGEIHQVAPYARYQYYGKLMVSSVTGSAYASRGEKKVLTSTELEYGKSAHPQAGKMWFARMISEKGDQILKGAATIAGGKARKRGKKK